MWLVNNILTWQSTFSSPRFRPPKGPEDRRAALSLLKDLMAVPTGRCRRVHPFPAPRLLSGLSNLPGAGGGGGADEQGSWVADFRLHPHPSESTSPIALHAVGTQKVLAEQSGPSDTGCDGGRSWRCV